MFTNALPSELAGVVGTIDPDAYALGAQSSDWADMADFEHLMAAVMVGDMLAGTINAKLEQATDSVGTGAKDIVGKAIAQFVGPTNNNNQAVINLRGDELDVANGFRFVRVTVTAADTASPPVASMDYAAALFGLSPKNGKASQHGLVSVAEIVS